MKKFEMKKPSKETVIKVGIGVGSALAGVAVTVAGVLLKGKMGEDVEGVMTTLEEYENEQN